MAWVGLAGRRRPGDVEPLEEPAQDEEAAVEPAEPEEEEEAQPSPSPSTPAESRLNSLIKRRRPLPGGLHRPQPHTHDN